MENVKNFTNAAICNLVYVVCACVLKRILIEQQIKRKNIKNYHKVQIIAKRLEYCTNVELSGRCFKFSPLGTAGQRRVTSYLCSNCSRLGVDVSTDALCRFKGTWLQSAIRSFGQVGGDFAAERFSARSRGAIHELGHARQWHRLKLFGDNVASWQHVFGAGH